MRKRQYPVKSLETKPELHPVDATSAPVTAPYVMDSSCHNVDRQFVPERMPFLAAGEMELSVPG